MPALLAGPLRGLPPHIAAHRMPVAAGKVDLSIYLSIYLHVTGGVSALPRGYLGYGALVGANHPGKAADQVAADNI